MGASGRGSYHRPRQETTVPPQCRGGPGGKEEGEVGCRAGGGREVSVPGIAEKGGALVVE